MKEITVENFNYSNVKAWIADYSHKEKVEFAIYCAELVIDLYTGNSDTPKRAIQAAKDWILNPSEENKQKCKDAAADAAYAARKSIKDKIINYISNKLAPQTKEVEWVNGDKCIYEGKLYDYQCVSSWDKNACILSGVSPESKPFTDVALMSYQNQKHQKLRKSVKSWKRLMICIVRVMIRLEIEWLRLKISRTT